MIIFKEKQYTLRDGHYTGPKDLDKVPSTLKVVGGATLAGYGAGVLVDKALGSSDSLDSTSWSTRGAELGFIGGVLGKLVLNKMHNPMETIKFNELDRCIRKSFGMYRISGVTVGDSRENRERMKESFVINSKNLTDFKINVSITKGQLVMYTLNLGEKEEEIIEETLDYYCKKYYGMKYTSTPIGNNKKGCWAITITFTNHQVAANFLVEIVEALKIRVNLLNNDISSEIFDISDRMFSLNSVPALDKFELKYIFSKGLLQAASCKKNLVGLSKTVMEMVKNGLGKLNAVELSEVGVKQPRRNFGNKYLEFAMKKVAPNKPWTIGENDRELNLFLLDGTLIITATHGTKGEVMLKKIPELLPIKNKNSNSASLFLYTMGSPAELEVVLKKILSTGIAPNIYVS